MRNLIQNSTSTFACKFEGVMIYLLKYMLLRKSLQTVREITDQLGLITAIQQ